MNQEQADARLHPVVELAGIVTLLRAAGNNPGQ